MKPVIALVVGWIVLLLAALAILDDAPASSSARSSSAPASSSSPPCVDECAERVQRRQGWHSAKPTTKALAEGEAIHHVKHPGEGRR